MYGIIDNGRLSDWLENRRSSRSDGSQIDYTINTGREMHVNSPLLPTRVQFLSWPALQNTTTWSRSPSDAWMIKTQELKTACAHIMKLPPLHLSNIRCKWFPSWRCHGKQKSAVNERTNERVYVGRWKILYLSIVIWMVNKNTGLSSYWL